MYHFNHNLDPKAAAFFVVPYCRNVYRVDEEPNMIMMGTFQATTLFATPPIKRFCALQTFVRVIRKYRGLQEKKSNGRIKCPV
jgi:hypothetical protein